MTHSIVYSCFENTILVKIMKLCLMFSKQDFKLSVYRICNNKCV